MHIVVVELTIIYFIHDYLFIYVVSFDLILHCYF